MACCAHYVQKTEEVSAAVELLPIIVLLETLTNGFLLWQNIEVRF